MKQAAGSPSPVVRITAAMTVPVVVLLLLLGSASPAGAHAQVSGSDPAEGAVLEAPPEHVTISFANKPVTSNGDPVWVYGPYGERVDSGAIEVLSGGRAISIALQDPDTLRSGSYHVAYRVLSRDAHLVTGRFGFQVEGGADAPTDELALPGAGISRSQTPFRREPADWWPKAFAAAVVVALVIIARRLRQPAS